MRTLRTIRTIRILVVTCMFVWLYAISGCASSAHVRHHDTELFGVGANVGG